MSNWKYLDNQFAVATRDNYKKALVLSNYHDAALQAAGLGDPALLIIYNRYHPLHVTYVSKYTQWKNAGGTQGGDTLSLEQLLTTASGNLADWDIAIQVIYKKGTPRYKTLFPKGRKVFNKGALDSRINAYNELSNAMGTDPALATIKAAVDATYTALDTARDMQEGAKGDVKIGSGSVNTARLAVMNMQYRDMGFVIDNYFDYRQTLCEALFDLATLRESEQRRFTGTLSIGETEGVLVHTFTEDDVIRLKVDGEGPVSFYLGSSAGATDSTAVIRTTNQDEDAKANFFGVTDYHTHRYLTAVNNSGVETHYLVEIE